MTTAQPYAVPIISGDLRRSELVKQCADTFDYLDSVSQDMFNRIATRLNIYRAQLNKFDERIQHANAHIDRIKGSKRAIQVHSSARYPVELKRSTYTSIFEYDTEKEENKPPVLHYNSFGLNETVDKFIDPNDKDSKSNDDTLIVFKQYQENFIQKTKRNVLNGLGRPPANIQSVISFLKYNTQENPYSQPTKIDPLNVGGRIRKQADEPLQPRIVETPLPAFYKQMSERPTTGDIGYNPTLGSVPILSLPDNLPELDNYATFDDNTTVDWTQQQMSSIAPSFAISMLPDIADLSTTTTTAVTTSVAEPPKTTIPPPSPVNMPAIIPLTSAATSVPPSAPPVPPPLPPSVPSLPSTLPSVLTPTPAADESQVSAEKVTTDDADDDGGNPLLAAIRNYGKTNKLKAVTKSNPVDAAPLPSSHEQENIMDSLKKRLQHRRGFITGETSSSTTGEKSVAAVPPPPPVPSTGGAFTDAIANKAREIAEQQRRQNDSDNDNDDGDDDNWE